MPKWGLTEEQIQARPWGLAPELLRPDKQITDPVHGDIYLTVLETAVLDTAPMQRLRRVRQLGTTHLVYPSATHTRLSHALGTLRAAQNLLDVVLTQASGRDPADDLFGEWRSDPEIYWDRSVGEATVLARLGGLLHDLGHVPFGHTLEDDLGFLDPHDANDARYETLWGAMVRDLEARGIKLPPELEGQLKPLILSKSKKKAVKSIEQRYPFIADIVGNTICADLVDYLQRDHLYTGLPAKFGSRFLDGFYVTRSDHPHQPERMVIQISRDGYLRADVVSELFKYLRYRYELSERVLVHHAKLAADVMVGKAMELWKAALVAEGKSEEAAKEIIEGQVLRRGDDGLLEHMLDQASGYADDTLWQGVAEVVSLLQARNLFKQIGVYTNKAMADNLYKNYGSAEGRAEVERHAASRAGLEDDWMVALWVPDPKMRFKPADVLVDDGSPTEIFTLAAWDRDNGQRDSELIGSHRGLWAARVYVHPQLTKQQRDLVLAAVQERIGITEWEGSRRRPVQAAIDPKSAGEQPLDRVAEYSPPTQPPLDRATMRAIAKLEEWRAAGRRRSIQHRELEARILAEGRFVVVDGKEFDLEKEEEIARLNLTLFLSQLPEDELETPDGRDRLSHFIHRSPTGFEERVLTELGTGEVVQRTDGETPEVAEGNLAFVAAAQKFLRFDW